MAGHDGQNAKTLAKERWSHEARQERQRCLADPLAERAVLAAILQDATAIDAAEHHIVSTDFYVPVHARAFEAMHALRANGDTIDRVTIGASIGHDAAEALVASLPADVNVGAIASYAAIVADKASARRLAAQLAESLDHLERGTPRDEIARAVEAAANAERRRASVTQLSNVIEDLIMVWEHPIPCTPTGLRQLDTLLAGGLRAGDLIGVAGTAGGGKSALVGQIALDAAQAGAVAVYASIEMSPAEVLSRWLACEAFRGVQPGIRSEWSLGYADILYGRAYRGEDSHGRPLVSQEVRARVFERIERARQALACVSHRLFVEQIEPGSTVEHVAALVRSARQKVAELEHGEHRPVVVVIDPLQRLFASPRAGRTGRAAEAVNGLETERVSAVAQELKYLADTEGLAVLFASDTTKSAALTPVSSAASLRGSYQINHLATLVLGLHTAETAEQLRTKLGDTTKPDAVAPELTVGEIQRLAEPSWWGQRSDAVGLGARIAVLECSKNRRGRTHAIALGFIPGATCFVEGEDNHTDTEERATPPPRRGSKAPGGPR